MPDEHIFERSKQERPKGQFNSRSAAPSPTVVAPPFDLPTTNHFNLVSAHAHYRTGHEQRFLPLPSTIPRFTFPRH
jgi:hypothetical protein